MAKTPPREEASEGYTTSVAWHAATPTARDDSRYPHAGPDWGSPVWLNGRMGSGRAALHDGRREKCPVRVQRV